MKLYPTTIPYELIYNQRRIYRPKGPPIAYCSSIRCYGYREKGEGRGVIKNVPKTTIDCPDCDHALFWHSHDL